MSVAVSRDPQTAGSAAQGAPPAEHVFQLSLGYVISSALNVVVKLGVADRLAAGPKTAAELAHETRTNADALYRVLRCLSTLGLFVEDADQRFRLTPSSDLLRGDAEGSLKALVSFISDPFHLRTYAELMHSVMTGQSAMEKVTGGSVFEYFARDPEEGESFNDAMTNFSAVVIPAVLDAYDFTGIGVLVDVAGGHGQVLTSILERYPLMRGVLSDLDHVIAGAKKRIDQLGLTGRCETAVVDFFTSVPKGGDAYIMKHIIHDWDDDRALVILRNVRAALEHKPHGRLILLEATVKGLNEPDLAKVIDLEMLAGPGGRERTEAEWVVLLSKAGFDVTRVVPTKSPLSVIEAAPRRTSPHRPI